MRDHEEFRDILPAYVAIFADENKAGDGHAIASAWLKTEFAYTDQTKLSVIQARALELLHIHTEEMEEKYGKQKAESAERE